MNIAAAIGTAFHDCVEQYLDGGVFAVKMEKYASCVPRVYSMMKSWIAWAESVDGTIEHTEMKVISRKHVYSGTFDAIGSIGGKLLVVDWKTGSKIYSDHALQLAAYAEAFNEMGNNKIKSGLIVHVSKDKPRFKVTVKEFKLGKHVFKQFLKLRQMFDAVTAPKVMTNE